MQAQRPFREYPAIEYDDFPLPSDWKDHKHEWVRARLRYPDIYGYPDRSRLRRDPNGRGLASGRWIIRDPIGTCWKASGASPASMRVPWNKWWTSTAPARSITGR